MNTREERSDPTRLSADDIVAMEKAAHAVGHLLDQELEIQTTRALGLPTILRVRPFHPKKSLIKLSRRAQEKDKPTT